MGEAGRRRAESLFDRRHNVATLHEWFTEAVERVATHTPGIVVAGERNQ
jgi:hypothetical protein